MTKYRLQSAPLINTPGLVRAARETNNTDIDYWVRVFSLGYSLPVKAAKALVKGEVSYTVDDENAVVFEYEGP